MTTALEGGEMSASRLDLSLLSGKAQYPFYRRLGGPPGPVWTSAQNLAYTGIWSPDRPARSQSLYWLSYTAHANVNNIYLNTIGLYPGGSS